MGGHETVVDGVPAADAQVTVEEFRAAMRRLVTGVTIIVARHEGRPWGMTVSAFTSVCAEPPTVLVCVNNNTVLARAMQADGRFAVNVLSQDQEFLSRLCAMPGAAKYLDDYCVPQQELPLGVTVPVLQDSLVTFDCELRESRVVGSHLVSFGEVTAVISPSSRTPLLYGEGRYHEPVHVDASGWRGGGLAFG
jgi:flavin reductase (DIM6/NTAB) family NADH-FMN oxidoreductase RutF